MSRRRRWWWLGELARRLNQRRTRIVVPPGGRAVLTISGNCEVHGEGLFELQDAPGSLKPAGYAEILVLDP